MELKAKISIDTSDLQKGINEAMKAGASLEQALEQNLGKIKLNVDADGFKKSASAVEQIAEQTGARVQSTLAKAFQFNQINDAVRNVTAGMSELSTPFIEFEKNVADLKAITGASDTALQLMGGSARQLAKDFGGTAAGQIESFKGVLSKLGPDIAKNPAALNEMGIAINTLAKASGLDAKTSMEALTTAMLQFGVDLSDPKKAASEMTRIMNIMASGAQVGAAEVPQVAEALKAAGVAAKGAGLSIEETNAAIQVMATGGKQGAEAGTALRNVLGLMQKASGPAEAALKKMGTSSKELGTILTTQGLAPALARMKEGIDGLSTAQERNVAMSEIFGMENAAAATIMMNSTDQLKSFTAGVTGTQTGFEQAAINMDTTAAKMDRFNAKVKDVFIGLFDSLGSGATAVIGSVNQLAPTLTSLGSIKMLIPDGAINKSKDAISKLGSTIKDNFNAKSIYAMTNSFVDFNKNAFKSIKSVATTLISTLLPSFATTSAGAVTSSTIMAGSLTTAGTAGTAAGTATQAAWAPFVAIGLAIAAAIAVVVGGFYLLYKNSEAFRNMIDGMVTAVKLFAIAVWDGLVAPFKLLWNLIAPILENVWNAIKGVGVVIGEVATVVYNAVGSGIISTFKLLGDFLAGTFSRVWDSLVVSVNAIGAAFVWLYDKAIVPILPALKILGGILLGIVAVGVATLVAPIVALGAALYNIGKIVVENLITGLQFLWNGVLVPLGAYIGGAFVSIWNGVVVVINSVIDSLKEAATVVKDVFLSAWDAIGSLFGKVKGWLSPIFSFISDKFNAVYSVIDNNFIKPVKNAFSSLVDVLGVAWGKIKGVFDAIGKGWDWLVGKGKGSEKSVANVADAAKKQLDEANKNAAKPAEADKKAEVTAKKKETAAKKQESILFNQYKTMLDMDKVEQKALKNKLDDTKNADDKLAIKQKELSLLEQEQRALLQLAATNKVKLKVGGGFEFPKTMKAEDAKNFEKFWNDNVDAINSVKKESRPILIQSRLEPLNINDDMRKQQEILDNANMLVIKAKFEAGDISKVQYDEAALKQQEAAQTRLVETNRDLQKKYAILQFKESRENLAKLRNEILANNGKIEQGDTALNNARIELDKTRAKERISGLNDINQQEYELSLFNLEQRYNAETIAARGNIAKQLALTVEYETAKNQIVQKYALENLSTIQKIQNGLAGSFIAAFQDLSIDIKPKTDSKVQDDFKAEAEKLLESYKNGASDYETYTTQLNDLDKKRTEALQAETAKQSALVAALNSALSKAFGQQADAAKNALNENAKSYNAAARAETALNEKLRTINDTKSKEYTDTLAQRDAATAASTEITGAAYENMGLMISASLMQSVADGQSVMKALVLSVLSAAQAMASVFAVMILGKELATKSFFGIATAAALTGLIAGALAVAKAAVSNMAFKDGGLNPFGGLGSGLLTNRKTVSITAGEAGSEFVVNHANTMRNLPLLRHINAGKVAATFFNTNNNSNDNAALVAAYKENTNVLNGIQRTLTRTKLVETNHNYNIQVDKKNVMSATKLALNRY